MNAVSMKGAIFNNPFSRAGWSARFEEPRAVHFARGVDEVRSVVDAAEEAARDGRWAVVYLAYEAAPAFDPAFVCHAPSDFPLACAAIFDERRPCSGMSARVEHSVSRWEPLVSRRAYDEAITAVREYIAAGDTYQVNYTFPLRCRFSGDARAWYHDLCAAQRAQYCCYVDLGRYCVLSLSPELFFERRGRRLRTRPMKGTKPRGRWLEEDDRMIRKLQSCPKNRAENLMIVDLLRNDLGRVASIGSVEVTKLFDIERYDTVLQMTSTVESECGPDTTLTEIMDAIFPCGSITGAPKIRTMEIIRELEPYPRHIYTGTMGFVQPGGDCVFNVAIRTVLLDTEAGVATCSVGGGITYDSTAEGEYDECLAKSAFLRESRPDFQLFESLLLDSGEYFLLERHLKRIQSSARHFGFPCSVSRLRAALEATMKERRDGRWKVRLLLARDGEIDVEAQQLVDEGKPRRVGIAARLVDSSNAFLFHKTTNRGVYKDALLTRPECDDVILWNEKGEVTESTIANVVVVKNGRKCTPPRTCGLLAGTFRNELLAKGEIEEKKLHRDDLRNADEIFLINSVRKWMRVVFL